MPSSKNVFIHTSILFFFFISSITALNNLDDIPLYVEIPFKIEFDTNEYSSLSEEERILKSLSFSSTVGELLIGTPYQKIQMLINSKHFYTYFISSDLNNAKIKGYNYKLSNTYEPTYLFQNKDIYDLDDYTNETHFYDILSISKNRPFLFPLATEFKEDSIQKYGGKIGLDVSPGEYGSSISYNILGKLKPIGAIRSYDFYFNYTSNLEGYLTIGKLPYDKNNDTFNENNFTIVKAETVFDDEYQHWAFPLDNFLINGECLGKKGKILFSFEEYLLTAPYFYLEIFEKHYFNSNQKKCKEIRLGDYFYFYCSSNIDLSKMGIISFQVYQNGIKTVFSFKPNELFYHSGNNKYFLIRFSSDVIINYWKLGQLFLSKFRVSFNQDSKQMLIPIIEEEKVLKEKVSSNLCSGTIIMFIIMIIIIGGLIAGFMHYIKTHKKRRIRAYELEDTHDYDTASSSNSNNYNIEMNKTLISKN